MIADEFTVVIPTYQRQDTIERAVRSVLDQRDVSFSLVVVDDGSADDTARVLAAIEDDRLLVHRQCNAGRCAARNTGAALSDSAWLVFLDSDDELMPGGLSRFNESMEGNELILAGVVRAEQDGAEQVHGARWDSERCLPLGMQAGAFAIRRTLFERIGGYCEDLEFSEHTEIALRLRRIHPTPSITILTDPTVRIHARPDRYDARVQYQTAVHLLDHAGAELAHDREARARYHGIAGVGASRLGMRRIALGHLWKSFVANPTPTAIARMARATVTRSGGIPPEEHFQ